MESDDNFQIDVKKLESLMFQRKKDMKDAIDSTYGGVDSLIKLLKSSQEAGIASNNAAVRSKLFGRNVIEVEKPKTFFKHVLDAACDKILILLMCAAIFSLLLSFFSNVNEADNNEPSESWIEGVAILLSVFIVIIVTATNDYSKEKKFRGLQKKVNDDVKVCVIRDSNLCQIHIADLVVGDVVQVKYGDLIPADGCLLACNDLKVDESMMTGESDHVKKSLENDLVMFGGSTIMEGSGKMLVLCVGMHSQNGLITKLLKNKLEPWRSNSS
uniref:Cation_ATPase_N domain-containing protein n=1 Tax=Rhabditophanes sp. KR3021 TaxID=114890 RepID=A0AC35U2I5_9BILA